MRLAGAPDLCFCHRFVLFLIARPYRPGRFCQKGERITANAPLSMAPAFPMLSQMRESWTEAPAAASALFPFWEARAPPKLFVRHGEVLHGGLLLRLRQLAGLRHLLFQQKNL